MTKNTCEISESKKTNEAKPRERAQNGGGLPRLRGQGAKPCITLAQTAEAPRHTSRPAPAALRSYSEAQPTPAALDLVPPVPLEDLLARRGLLCLAAGRALGAGGVARAAAARGSPRRSRCHWVLKVHLVSGCGTVHEARTAHRMRPTRRACRAARPKGSSRPRTSQLRRRR